MMTANWDMTPVKGGSGNAFSGKIDKERIFIKKNGSPFLPSIYLEGITPKVLWTKRTAEGDTLSAQPWIDGHTLSPEDMSDRQINHILAHLHDSKKLVESYKKLGSQVIPPKQLLENCVKQTKALQTNRFLSSIIEEMYQEIPELQNDEVVVVHGDVNHKNWLVDDASGKIYLVDWDTVFLSDSMVDMAHVLSHYIQHEDWSLWLMSSGVRPRADLMDKVAWYGKLSFLRQISEYLVRGKMKEVNQEILGLRNFCELF
ncbi:phosphotransferase family protein [Lactococcus protaetiae]|uniref:Phosphotransferase family protein n=1 Tax=Lactococcus protaetiae TaxID=2592653 RepID=A0A514Z8G2_9LACT|nr:phosphotransferase family protein [Lactococcus protaetiae]